MGRFLKMKKKSKKVICSAYGKLFFNQNRVRYEILVETKKFRLDVTILKDKKKSEENHFFGLRKINSQTTYFFLNQNR